MSSFAAATRGSPKYKYATAAPTHGTKAATIHKPTRSTRFIPAPVHPSSLPRQKSASRLPGGSARRRLDSKKTVTEPRKSLPKRSLADPKRILFERACSQERQTAQHHVLARDASGFRR